MASERINNVNPTDVYFNGAYLNALLDIYNLEVNNYPEFEIKKYKIARADKSVITAKEAVEKEIVVLGKICDTTRVEVEQFLVLLKTALLNINGQLKVYQAGYEVNYVSTCTQISQRWVGNTMMVALTFVASNPYGVASPATVLNLPNITTANETFTLVGFSSAPIRPQITVNYNSITDGTGKSVTIRNAVTQIGITVNEDFVTGDILYIDSSTDVLSVTLNGATIDFTGSFPVFYPTLAGLLIPEITVEYSDTFTARDLDGTFTFNIRV